MSKSHLEQLKDDHAVRLIAEGLQEADKAANKLEANLAFDAYLRRAKYLLSILLF